MGDDFDFLFYDSKRVLVDPSVPEDMVLFPDEETRKTWIARLNENEELDKSCHERQLEILLLKKRVEAAQILAITLNDLITQAHSSISFGKFPLLDDAIKKACESFDNWHRILEEK